MESVDGKSKRVLIVGAGPAGLTAAYELSKQGVDAAVFEMDSIVGGISRTASYKGYRFDIGGHRFFTKVPEVQQIWKEILGDEFLVRPRLSRIFFNDTFFDYPLKPLNALLGLGPIEAVRIGLSFVKAKLLPMRPERTFEAWVSNRFGSRLYELFFRTYTEKVWGMSCSEMSADWAAQRIKNLDLGKALRTALLGSVGRRGEQITSLIEEFHYPRLGPGMMWEKAVEVVAERGIPTHLETAVGKIRHRESRVESIVVRDADGQMREERGTHFLSSMPLQQLIEAFDPPPPPDVLAAARRLRYRDFLTVVLILNKPDSFPDNWIYIHSSDVLLGRVQNFKNWSPEMVPDPETCSLGLEYFLHETDELWNRPDADLVELGRQEAARIGLIDADDVIDGCVVRMPKAYPVYDSEYQDCLAKVRGFLDKFPNLESIGRNGQHRYNNQDHSMMTAVYAVRRFAGEEIDPWDVNVEEDYHEQAESESSGATGERLVPQPVAADATLDWIRSAFGRYDPIALGTAIGAVGGVAMFLATALLLVRGGDPLGPNLSLLGNYLFGFTVSWPGAFVGLVEMALLGFGFGVALAMLINGVVGWQLRRLLAQFERAHIEDWITPQ